MAGHRSKGGQGRSNRTRQSGTAEPGARQTRQPSREQNTRPAGARAGGGRDSAPREFAPGEFFTLGEHTVGRKHYRFRYNGKVYRIMEGLALPKPPAEEADGLTVVTQTVVAGEDFVIEEAVGAEGAAAIAVVTAETEPEETLLLEEADAKKAYEAWNRIKRPQRFGA